MTIKAQTELFGKTGKKKKEAGKRKKPIQHEKKYMEDIIKTAFALGLPCIHIKQHCGNKFGVFCSGNEKKPHEIIQIKCPICNEVAIATCFKKLNTHLKGEWDILGIAWAIETKHKRNKGKQKAELSVEQELKGKMYSYANVPTLVVNEAQNVEAYKFLKGIAERNGEKI